MSNTVLTALRRLKATGEEVAAMELPYPASAPSFGPACCDAEIEELLASYRAAVPGYATFLSACRRIDGADVHNGYFIYSPLTAVTQLHTPRRIVVGDEPRLREVPVLAVGGDGCGNAFLIGLDGPEAEAVWKWNHEHPPREDGVGRTGLVKIADSFVAFLDRLATDWERFASGDTTWTYVSG